jgi:hypothetical protein
VAPENSRITALRRRVQEDPASIAFAQLAEECRRLGHFEEAVSYCRTGLARHPEYLSARVTLARALIELGAWADAEAELQVVLISAPDNVVALRAMAAVYQHHGDSDRAHEYEQRAVALTRVAPGLDEIAGVIDREIAAGSRGGDVTADARTAPSASPLLDFDALLASLGVPSAAPPPVIESVLSGETPSLAEGPWVSEPGDTGGSEDAFSTLERELRAFEERSARLAPATLASGVEPPPADDEGLSEFEAWLQALSDDRARARSAP